MKHRIVLTRGEVDQIVRAKLAHESKIPDTNPPGATRRLAILPADIAAWPAADTRWEDWPAYTFEWEEELPT